MLSKIARAENIGGLDEPVWQAGDHEFKRVTLVFGFNGSGKTALSNAIRLFQEGVESEELLSNLRARADRPAAFGVVWDGRTLAAGSSQKKLLVFNDRFVAEHVYDGTASRVRRFKSDVVTAEQLKNPEISKLDKALTAAEAGLRAVQEQLRALENQSEVIRKRLSGAWNKAITAHRLTGIGLAENRLPESPPSKTLDTLTLELQEHFQKFSLQQKQADLNSGLVALDGLPANTAPEIDSIACLDWRIEDVSVNAVQKKVAHFRAVKTKHGSVEQWFEDGAAMLEAARPEQKCPLCDSSPADFEAVARQYTEYFNQEFAGLQGKLAGLVEALDQAEKSVGEVTALQTRTSALAAKYSLEIARFTEATVQVAESSSREVLDAVKLLRTLVQRKQAHLSAVLSDDEREAVRLAEEQIRGFVPVAQSAMTARSQLSATLRGMTFDPKAARGCAEAVFWREFDDEVGSGEGEGGGDAGETEVTPHGGIKRYRDLKKVEGGYTRRSDELTRERNALLVKLRNESQFVNRFMRTLGVNNIQVRIGEKDGDEVDIHYVSGTTKRGLAYSLSEGERTALAFAYFLSKIQYEVVDNTRDRLDEYVVVIDDPISSLDENRLAATASLIRRFFVDQAKQVIVLSHNLVFLKHFASGLTGKNNRDREDFYIEQGTIQELPLPLRNFHTSYFYKLGKIREYIDGHVKYEDARDYIPGYLRTVIETFLSFKLGRLAKSEDGADRFRAPGFEELILATKKVDCSGYRGVDGVSSQTELIDLLYDLQRRLNPDTHGTPQDLTDFEYMSETELKRCCADVMAVLAYLDQVHLDGAKQLEGVSSSPVQSSNA